MDTRRLLRIKGNKFTYFVRRHVSATKYVVLPLGSSSRLATCNLPTNDDYDECKERRGSCVVVNLRLRWRVSFAISELAERLSQSGHSWPAGRPLLRGCASHFSVLSSPFSDQTVQRSRTSCVMAGHAAIGHKTACSSVLMSEQSKGGRVSGAIYFKTSRAERVTGLGYNCGRSQPGVGLDLGLELVCLGLANCLQSTGSSSCQVWLCASKTLCATVATEGRANSPPSSLRNSLGAGGGDRTKGHMCACVASGSQSDCCNKPTLTRPQESRSRPGKGRV